MSLRRIGKVFSELSVRLNGMLLKSAFHVLKQSVHWAN